MTSEEAIMQKTYEKFTKEAIFTLDFVISGKKHTINDIQLCQSCQLQIRDKIESNIYDKDIDNE